MSDTIKGEAIPENDHPEFSGTTAVRVYDPANATGDFPVLKAFQEYLEAEQAKAHKRMLSLAIFFMVLLVIVVLTFTIITSSLISGGHNRDQKNEETMSALLMELAKGRLAPVQAPAAAPIVNVQPSQPATASDNKQMFDKMAAMELEARKAIAAAEARAAAAEARAHNAETQALNKPHPLASANGAVPQSPTSFDALARQNEENRRQQEALRAAREAREKLQAELKAEKEALHKVEVEKHLRKLYPDHYAREDAKRAEEEARKNPPPALPPVAANPSAPAQVPAAPTHAATAPLLTAVPPPPPPPPKKSALQQILDTDDAPVPAPTTGDKSRLTDAEQKKIEAELKRILADVERIEAEGRNEGKKPAGDKAEQAKPQPPSPSPAAPAAADPKAPKPQSPKTESLNVGAKDGKSIPWLVEVPGETPIAAKDGAKKPEAGNAPQKPDPKKADPKKAESKPAK